MSRPHPARLHGISTPLGDMVAVADHQSLRLLVFGDSPTLDARVRALGDELGAPVEPGQSPILDQLAEELGAYFAGCAAPITTPLGPLGTPFQQRAWRELVRIPHGQTRSYGQIARALGDAGAVRAAGRANALNPIAILIPCHRVVAGNGSLCGYAGGLWRKQRLLELEACAREPVLAFGFAPAT